MSPYLSVQVFHVLYKVKALIRVIPSRLPVSSSRHQTHRHGTLRQQYSRVGSHTALSLPSHASRFTKSSTPAIWCRVCPICQAWYVPNGVQITEDAKSSLFCRAGLRTETSIVAETAQSFSTHHTAVLIGYGAHAVCPYLALETCRQWRSTPR